MRPFKVAWWGLGEARLPLCSQSSMAIAIGTTKDKSSWPISPHNFQNTANRVLTIGKGLAILRVVAYGLIYLTQGVVELGYGIPT